MGFKADCESAIEEIAKTPIKFRSGRVVPRTEDVALRDGGVLLNAAYLYADMSDSTGLARNFSSFDAAIIIRAYLSAVSMVIRHRGGEIRSFDGDRVMGIFVGDNAASVAAKAALNITWVVDQVVHNQLKAHVDEYFDVYRDGVWKLGHRTGIDVGWALVVRAGVRANNDLVSIGEAPNIAAKLSDFTGWRTNITQRTWDAIDHATLFSEQDGLDRWVYPARQVDLGGGLTEMVSGSNWKWAID
ncbi:adenylate/guanylate cyclase domain-containing protein [Nocardia rhizosphaerihabitans]|uniref:adenylate/guanylate cyclase domain-containing protein n=1 Tax=Nocardia rhizosphaerihabitans TaxID=1691570 RepID=UPI00366DAC31